MRLEIGTAGGGIWSLYFTCIQLLVVYELLVQSSAFQASNYFSALYHDIYIQYYTMVCVLNWLSSWPGDEPTGPWNYGSHSELLTTAIRHVGWVNCPYLTMGVFSGYSGFLPPLKNHENQKKQNKTKLVLVGWRWFSDQLCHTYSSLEGAVLVVTHSQVRPCITLISCKGLMDY